MPWKETCTVDERLKFIAACQQGLASVSALCRRYGISRKTGHKWRLRYRCEGAFLRGQFLENFPINLARPPVTSPLKGEVSW